MSVTVPAIGWQMVSFLVSLLFLRVAVEYFE